ncbi:MAG: LysO family transporter [Tissierellales bacterium]|nr:LysO family transporter [Tissierellales bacterium]
MTTRLLMYLAIIILGGLIGANIKLKENFIKRLGSLQTACLLFLLFVMGIKIGMDDKVINSFLSIGLNATVISIFTIGFSIIFTFIVNKLFFGGKQ